MGLSGYSSVHWPPGAPSESTTWQVMPNNPSSKTWNSPQGPAPMIKTSVTMAGFGEISDKPNSFGRDTSWGAELYLREPRPLVPRFHGVCEWQLPDADAFDQCHEARLCAHVVERRVLDHEAQVRGPVFVTLFE